MSVKSRYISLLAIIICVNIGLLTWAWFGGLKLLSAENGIIENAQVALIFMCAVVYAYIGIKTDGALRSAALLMFGVCVIGIIREVDFRNAPDSMAVIKFLFGPARDVIFGTIGVIMLGYFILVRTHISRWISIVFSKTAWALYLAVACIIASSIISEVLPASILETFTEEIFELNGYALLLLASLELVRLGHKEMALP